MIAIIDYGMGNLRSVETAFEKYCDEVVITDKPEVISAADKIVLPGVGAFRDAIALLREKGLDRVIRTEVEAGKPFLGICLGFQLLFAESFENGHYSGLDLLPGSIVDFADHIDDDDLKIPHMGWNQLSFPRSSALFEGVEEKAHVYFVHSYFLQTASDEIVSATTDYGLQFPVAVAYKNMYGTQFHPEKSQAVGLKIIENFVKRC